MLNAAQYTRNVANLLPCFDKLLAVEACGQPLRKIPSVAKPQGPDPKCLAQLEYTAATGSYWTFHLLWKILAICFSVM